MSRSVLGVLLVLALPGCGSCEPSTVPFGLDGGRVVPTPPRPASDGLRDEPRAAALAIDARELPDGTLRARAGDAELELGGETIRAVAEGDFDSDGDRDVLAVGGGTAARGPCVVLALRDGAALGPPIELAAAPALAPGCAIESASIRALAGALLAARVEARCPADDERVTRLRHAFVISSGQRPRVRERFVLRARERDGREESLELRAEDRDGDGNADVLASLALLAEGEHAPADVTLVFFDRPAGLARDPSEPEARISALAAEARAALRRRPGRARGLAARAIAVWEALCREAPRPRLEVGGQVGLPCGRSSAAGRALSLLVQAAVRSGDPIAAIAAYEALSSAGVQVRDAERDAARAALEGMQASSSAVHEGPIALAPDERPPRLSVLGFLDEERLLVRGPGARVIRLDEGTEQPAGAGEGALALADPGGRHRVVAVERRCEGTVIVVAALDPMADLGDVRRTVLLAPRRAPPGAPCPDLTPALRADDDGWYVLGWAPQGVLAARGTELRLVPLDVEGRAAGPPVVIGPREIAPLPVAPGHATSDVRFWAYATPYGIVVVDLGAERRTRFVRPQGWSPAEGTAIDVAVSPSGRRIAWISGGRVRWVDLGAPEG
jgi:hypothetical protein